MPRLLYETDSTDRHVNMTRRHIRLCKKTKGAEKYATTIQPTMQELLAKQTVTAQKTELRQDAYDDMVLSDTDLDNCVKTAFERCKQYDRDIPGERVLARMFPEEKFSHITTAAYTLEPDMVDELIIRFGTLTVDHPLAGVAADLQTKVDSFRTKFTHVETTIRAQKQAEAEEEIAKMNLRRKYEDNYLAARKELGKVVAERLYPQIGTKTTPVEPEETAPEGSTTA
jgi:hypothetical protein